MHGSYKVRKKALSRSSILKAKEIALLGVSLFSLLLLLLLTYYTLPSSLLVLLLKMKIPLLSSACQRRHKLPNSTNLSKNFI